MLVGGVYRDAFILARVESVSQVQNSTSSVEEILTTTKHNVITLNKYNKNNVNVNNVRAIATKLVEKLDDPQSFKYFCMVAWNLPESVIWVNLEQALTGREPKKYFSFLCNLELKHKSKL